MLQCSYTQDAMLYAMYKEYLSTVMLRSAGMAVDMH